MAVCFGSIFLAWRSAYLLPKGCLVSGEVQFLGLASPLVHGFTVIECSESATENTKRSRGPFLSANALMTAQFWRLPVVLLRGR
jgi:hypothetical protein